MTIRVLIVDDSAIVRRTLETELGRDSEIEVVGTASDPYIAREKIVELKPDVITLDIEMPRMDGLTFLRKLMAAYPLPVIVVSSLSKSGSEVALDAIRAGAVEVMAKPGAAYSVGDMSVELRHKIRAAVRAKLPKVESMEQPARATASKSGSRTATVPAGNSKIVLIGASTGGTQALETVLRGFPADSPPTVIVQHMPAGFTKAFADRLNQICEPEIKEAEHGEELCRGKVLVAPGNRHLLLQRSGGRLVTEIRDGPLVGHHRPAVNVLFHSAAQCLGANAVAVMLTGMGSDGAQGMLKMREAGAVTIGQDEQSCVVYGMPKAAFDIGAVEHVVPLSGVANEILRRAGQSKSNSLSERE